MNINAQQMSILLEFLNSNSKMSRYSIIKNHHDVIFHSSSIEVIVKLLEQHRGNPDIFHRLEQCAAEIERCHNLGIDSAYSQELDNIFTQEILPEQLMEIENFSEKSQFCAYLAEHPEMYPFQRIMNDQSGDLLPTLLSKGKFDEYEAKLSLLKSPQDLPEKIKICQDFLSYVDPTLYPEVWAAWEGRLGNCFLNNPIGDFQSNIEKAITHFQLALKVNFPKSQIKQKVFILNDLGLAFRRIPNGDKSKNLEKALHYLHASLYECDENELFTSWSVINISLAMTYAERIKGEKSSNIKKALTYCNAILNSTNCVTHSPEWAKSHRTLAKLFVLRNDGDLGENIEEAMLHSKLALEVFTIHNYPVEWAEVNLNLITIFTNRSRGDRKENIENAIFHANQAFQVFNELDYPIEFADVNIALANTYLNRKTGFKKEKIQRTMELLNYGLGNPKVVYDELVYGGSRENVELAIGHLAKALTIYSNKNNPFMWARIQVSLGIAYSKKRSGDRKDNYRQAIQYLDAALEILFSTPEDKVKILQNLALLYLMLEKEEVNEDSKEKYGEIAIEKAQLALESATESSLSNDYRFLGVVGDFLFLQNRWRDALHYYAKAISTSELLLNNSYTEETRKELYQENSRFYSNGAYCFLRINRIYDAINLLERGKTRKYSNSLLSDSASHDLTTTIDIDKINLLNLKVKEIEFKIKNDHDFTPDTNSNLTAQLEELRMQLLLAEFRISDNDLIANLYSAMPPNIVVIIPIITYAGSVITLIDTGTKDFSLENVIWIDDFNTEKMADILIASIDEKTFETQNGWLQSYLAYRRSESANSGNDFFESIVSSTKGIWHSLIEPIFDPLVRSGKTHLVIIPESGLQLLPLQAAWHYKAGIKKYLIDYFEVSYSPSLNALLASSKPNNDNAREALLIGVDNYEKLRSLNFAVQEVSSISKLLNSVTLINSKATREAFYEEIIGKDYIHLACHGSYSWDGNPLDSALYLSQDTKITLRELLSRNLNLSNVTLITLSACESGISEMVNEPQSEFVGFPMSFAEAGAKAVISSLWVVDDISTSLLMDKFYSLHLEMKKPLATALRESQIWLRDVTQKDIGDWLRTSSRISLDDFDQQVSAMLKSSDNHCKYSNPYYWASFVLLGI